MALRGKDIENYARADLVANACAIYAYAGDAKEPIIFAHYRHEHTIPYQTIYSYKSEMCKMLVFLAGEIDFLGKDSIYRPGYGDVVLLRAGEPYTTCFNKQSHVDYYEINIPADYFEKVTVPNPCRAPFYDWRMGERNVWTMSADSCEQMMGRLKEIEWLIESGNERVDLLAYSYLIQILELVQVHVEGNSPQRVQSVHVPDKLKSAVEYIHSHYLNILSMEEVAAHCGVTNTYLSRIFKNVLGTTPGEYVTNLRISHAKYLLSNGSTLTDACYHSGFNNYTYFITKFKSVAGVTPARFKKRT